MDEEYNDDVVTDEKAQSDEQEAEQQAQEEVMEPEEQEMLLGKFRNPEEMAASYSELEKKLGQQGQEVGTLKQMNQMMLEQMQQYNAQAKTPPTQDEAQAQAVDYDSQLKQLSEAVETGDLSIGEALIQANAIAKDQATQQALSEYEKLNQKRSLENTKSQFLKNNPDFTELQKSGALEHVKEELPGLHDDFSAYYALKAQQAQQAVAAKQEVKRISKGDARTEKVLQKPGTPQTRNIGKPQNGRPSDFDIKQSMLKRMGG